MKGVSGVIDLLTNSGKIYGQSADTFYVSRREYLNSGLHLAILPPYQANVFSEYTLANKKDGELVINSFKNGIFKSFYCSLCALREPDNYSTKNIMGDLVPQKNLARNNTIPVNVNGVSMRATLTVPQYYYNHIMVVFENHVATYIILLDPKSFTAVMKLVENCTIQSRQNVVAIFNGRFGSDTSHAHVHLTSQAFSVLEEVREFIRASTFSADEVKSYSVDRVVVKGVCLISKTIDSMFIELSRYVSLIYTEYGEYYLSADFFVEIVNSISHYALFIIVGKRANATVTVGTITIGSILPGQILVLNTVTNVDRVVVNEAIGKLSHALVPANDLIRRATSNHATISDFISQIYARVAGDQSVSEVPVELMQLFILQAKQQGVNVCDIAKKAMPINAYLGKKDCMTRDCKEFHLYKLALSYYVVCSGESVHSLVYNKEIFFVNAMYLELNYASKVFGLDSFLAVYLSGSITSKILDQTFQDLFFITSIKPSVDLTSLTLTGGWINDWLNYKWQQIGEPSGAGVVTKSEVRLGSGKRGEVVIKINRNVGNPYEEKMFIQEFATGVIVNKLRVKVPNFVMTLGGFTCNATATLSKVIGGDDVISYPAVCQTLGVSSDFILLERIPVNPTSGSNMTFGSFVKNFAVPTEPAMELFEFAFFSVLCQILSTLAYAQQEHEFTHYDLHADNVMIYEFMESPEFKDKLAKAGLLNQVNKDLCSFSYHFDGKETLQMLSHHIAIIFDFGQSHVSGLSSYFTSPLRPYINTSQENKVVDLYGLIAYCFMLIVSYKPNIFIKTGGGIRNGPLYRFYRGFFLAFSDLFTFDTDLGQVENFMADVINVGLTYPGDQNNVRRRVATYTKRADAPYFWYFLDIRMPLEIKVQEFKDPHMLCSNILSYLMPKPPPTLDNTDATVKFHWGSVKDSEVGMRVLAKEQTKDITKDSITKLRRFLKK